MKLLRSTRWILMALLLSLVPASSHAGVFISVGIAPPALPVYEQPPCPQPGWMWTPGYWAYGPDGYYWVPGTWVPAPYEGALWTPGYWGWSTGVYVWHPGYWGQHVGYYGGVNYGFGYMGVGFAGGMWRGHDFVYNTAVVHVNERVVHTTYVDRTVVVHNTIINDRHVGYSGGPGGIHHEPLAEERIAEHDQHMERTSFQNQHMDEAMHDRNAYFKNNSGRPDFHAPDNHPAPESHYSAPAQYHQPQQQQQPRYRQAQQTQFEPRDNHQMPAGRPNNYDAHPGSQPDYRQAQQTPFQPHDSHQMPAGRPTNYEAHPTPQSQPQPQQHSQGHEQQSHPQHENHEHGKGR
jgi:hypothetical protein